MKKLLLAASALSATLLAGAAVAQDAPPTPAPGGPMGPGMMMRLADANKDGVITRAELLAHADARFAKLDANKDGKLSPDELKAARPGGGKPGKRKGARMAGPGDEMAARMFKMLDTDGDGQVSLAEHRAMAEKQFTMVDANKDGKIDQSEMQAMRDRRGAPPGDPMRPGGPDGPRGRGGPMEHRAMLDRVDANHDGVITREEMVAAAEARFAKLDANHDGKIDESERKAMRDRMMQNRERRGPPPGEMPPPPPEAPEGE
ncbi:MAG: EF-hand domain-containing protein [Pseudomonadota bacterium]